MSDFCGGSTEEKITARRCHCDFRIIVVMNALVRSLNNSLCWAEQEYKFRHQAQAGAGLMRCWSSREHPGNGTFYLSSCLMLTVGKPDLPGIIKAFATWGFLACFSLVLISKR